MTKLAVHVEPESIPYTGRELRSHFALDRFGLYGDAAVGFVGPCRVELTEMVDLEDVRNGESIYSPSMVHVLVEHFGLALREAVLRQRLLVRLAGDLLIDRKVSVEIRGDDIYVEGRKASVSIATVSPTSVLLHLGINVETEGTPVPTWGLAEIQVEPLEFCKRLLDLYAAEIDDIDRAVSKVRGVR